MQLPVIRLGDTSDHGGRVVSGIETFKVHGVPVACMGDSFDCPIHGVNAIVEGAHNRRANGKPMAYEGARTSCGASLVASCRTFTVSIEGNPGASAAAVRSAQSPAQTAYDEHFEFKDQTSGRPMPEVIYEFSSLAGIHHGRSDADGRSDHAFGSSPEKVELTHAVQTRMGIRE
jgi:uncharacterized Zn-binding protein involved in type VI secretion